MPGTPELIIIAGLALLFFGPKKLPELARSVGGAITSFREGLSGEPPSPKKREEGDGDGDGDDDDNDSPRLEPPAKPKLANDGDDVKTAEKV
jgi:TatA/E family protein of Tat protein translocase